MNPLGPVRPFVGTETWEVGMFSLPETSSASGVIMVNSPEGIRLLGRMLLNMAAVRGKLNFQNWHRFEFTRLYHGVKVMWGHSAPDSGKAHRNVY